MNKPFILWFIIGVLSSVFSVFFVKEYITSKKYIWVALSVISILLLLTCYFQLFTYQNTAIIYTLLKITSILLVLLFDYFVFHSKLTFTQWIGILLSMVSVYLLAKIQ